MRPKYPAAHRTWLSKLFSPSNRPGALLQKVSEFLEAGTSTVLGFDPAKELVVIHDQSGTPRVVRAPERADCGAWLPGLSWNVRALFRDY